MNLKVYESDEALADIIDIASYLADASSLNTSDSFIEATKRGYQQIAAMPRMGSLRDYGNPAFAGMRMWPVPGFRKYLIFYKATEDEVAILRVLHGARNLDAIFAPENE